MVAGVSHLLNCLPGTILMRKPLAVSPYGKVEETRKDFREPEIGEGFWKWSEEQVRQYF